MYFAETIFKQVHYILVSVTARVSAVTMAFLVTLVVFFTFSAVANTQVASNNSFPVTYNTTILEGGPNGGCPATEDSEVARNTISQDVRQELRSIASRLGGGLPDGIGSACCGLTEGWTRVVYLNMSNSSQQCPSGWEEASQPVRSCGRVASSGRSCDSVIFATSGLSYSRVCGHLRGYQVGYNNAFSPYSYSGRTIDSVYVDGVSITYGSPRMHIWTLAVGRSDTETGRSGCPCLNAGTARYSSPPFVGQNYFCESGTPTYPSSGTAVSSEPLWDGEGCPATSSCCQFNNPPYFCRVLPSQTTDNIEIRICGDTASTNSEDTHIDFIEIYIQ